MTPQDTMRMALVEKLRKQINWLDGTQVLIDLMQEAADEIEALKAALAQPNEADELLRNLHLDPERYRTEGGAINHLKVRAAILNPRDYCDHEWVTAPASLGGQLCSKCGRMK